MRVCVRAYVRVRACVRARARVCVGVRECVRACINLKIKNHKTLGLCVVVVECREYQFYYVHKT